MALIALFPLAQGVWGQQATGSIRGMVTDPSGAVVPQARVWAMQQETGFMRVARTDAHGTYSLVLLPIGHYRLEALKPGFRKYVQNGIILSVNQVAVIPLRLILGSSQQTVEVKADVGLVQTTTNDLGETVRGQEIVDLPLNGRNFTQLGLLLPGDVPLTPGLLEAGGTLRSGQSYAVNGQRPESNEFLIDGVENYNTVDAGFVLEPPPDAIAEFRILTNTAPAEFGHNAGSTTNIVTKSGSNQFHGDAWDFLRNDALDTRSFFSPDVQPYKQNQFGGTLGGPIRKNKTFFFVYYEGLRNRQGETEAATVPSLPERQGDFSQSIDPSTGKVLPLINELTGQPFPGNQLPATDPISQNVLQFYPLPNDGVSQFVTTQMLQNDSDEFGARIDHYLSPRDSMFVRYMFSNGSQVDPLSISGANVPGFPVSEDYRAQNAAIEETHSFSPTVVNVAAFSFLRNKLLSDQALNHTPLSSLGFQYPSNLSSQAGPPFIEVEGYASVGDPITGPNNAYQNTFSLSDSVNWIHGRHDVKIGGGYQRSQINVLQGIASNGFFAFTPFPVSNALASCLIGQPVVFLQGGGDSGRALRANSYDLYAQDSYKVNSRLTLNAGLRYELPIPYSVVGNQTALFEPNARSKVMSSAPAGLLYPGDPGVPPRLIQTDDRGFAPRFGLAWDPTGSGHWAVRTAYGIFYDPYYNGEGGPLQAPISAPPWLKTIQEEPPSSFANPLPSGENPFAPNFSNSQTLTLLTLDPHLRLPYAQDWNFTVERSFGQGWLLNIGYVGTKGTKLTRMAESDPALYIPGQSTEDNVNQRRLYSGCTLAEPNNCAYGSIGLISGIANSDYNALRSSLQKRFNHGIEFMASYTYSKTLDDVSSFNLTGSSPQLGAGENDLAQNPFDLEAEYGRSLFDARHRFVLSYIWQIPLWKQPHNWYEYAFGNWQANGIFTASTGTPFTVYDSSDPSLQGQSPEISGFYGDRPNLVGNPNNGPKTPEDWFNLQAFERVTQPGQFGSSGRNVVQAPGLVDWDFSFFKNFHVAESKSLQFRAEIFNLLNRPNFGVPVNDINSPSFGQIQSASPPRLIQLALKFLF
ncbi:MAG: carboxypeptidase regulatory-like domain-containing protein [Terriglobia bacterium]